MEDWTIEGKKEVIEAKEGKNNKDLLNHSRSNDSKIDEEKEIEGTTEGDEVSEHDF